MHILNLEDKKWNKHPLKGEILKHIFFVYTQRADGTFFLAGGHSKNRLEES